MSKRSLWICLAILSLITSCIGTIHQGYPATPRLYVALPGLYVGLLSGFFGGPLALEIPIAIVVNALTYYLLPIIFIRFAVFVRNRTH